ncbi:MAG: beta-galactosidase [Thermomicrobiales bacterium]
MVKLIDRQESFALGVCYYPEHWPEDRWAGYARQMRELGLAYVRIGEFAWSRMEPTEGKYTWDWLDRAIDILAAEDLKVVLGTPTATPPAWLIRAHPEILPVDAQDRTRNFGSRRHYDFSSDLFMEYADKIVRAMAERYGQHPAVVGWQIDNEFGCHDTARSYTPSARSKFQAWLSDRYETLERLNEAWGNIFWSQEYTAWDQIGLPILTVAQPNPSHVLDFFRYSSDQVVAFMYRQTAILRELSPGRWVTHNFMRLQLDFDHFKAAAPLDFASWDSYPTGSLALSSLPAEEKPAWARQGHPDQISFNHDLYRGLLKGRSFWVMEQQPGGQINWAPSNPLPLAGAVTLWTAQAWAHGASTVSYFRWRAATVAQELMHAGLLRHDETLDRGGQEIAELTLAGLPIPEDRAEVVLLHDYESLWAYDAQPHTENASYWEQVQLYYRVLRSLGVDVDIRHPDDDLSGYRVIVAPALQLVDQARADHLSSYAFDANLVFGPRTGYRTMSGRVHETGQPGPLTPLLGCALLNFDGLMPGMTVTAGNHVVTTWAENYRLNNAEALVAYTSGPLAGTPAVAVAGKVTTIGAWSAWLVQELLEGVLTKAGVATRRMPEGVRVTKRGDVRVWTNFTEDAVSIDGGPTIGPISYAIEQA